VLELCSLENVPYEETGRKGQVLRQDVDSIFWEVREATRGKALERQEWGRRAGCITESRLED